MIGAASPMETPPQSLSAFREDVRAFLRDEFTPELREAAARQTGVFAERDLALAWQRRLHARGWSAPYWPQEHGGPGWSDEQREIFFEECAQAGAPNLPAMGLQMCGPVIMQFGAPEQKAYFLPRILSGEHYWCQGYSEPQAGSDLASLKTSARRDGDDYIVNGSKMWTTHAHYANWIFLLVRTDAEARQQRGISFLVTPLDAPGVTIRPILSLSGEHEVNQVFLDDVRIPARFRIGEENQGWAIAKYLLEFERGGRSIGPGLLAAVQRLRAIAGAEAGDSGGSLLEDSSCRRRIAGLEIEALAADWTDQRLRARQRTHAGVGAAEASMRKLLSSELSQRLDEAAITALGVYQAADQRQALDGCGANEPVGPAHALTPTARFLNGRAKTIYGGASEVQRNILFKLIDKQL